MSDFDDLKKCMERNAEQAARIAELEAALGQSLMIADHALTVGELNGIVRETAEKYYREASAILAKGKTS